MFLIIVFSMILFSQGCYFNTHNLAIVGLCCYLDSIFFFLTNNLDSTVLTTRTENIARSLTQTDSVMEYHDHECRATRLNK